MDDIGIRTFKARAVAEPTVDDNKILETVPLFWDRNPLGLARPDDYASLMRAYRSWVYICSSKNGRAFASTPLKLYVTKQSTKQKVYCRTKQVNKETRKWLETQANFTSLPQVRKAVEILEVPDHVLLDMVYHVNKFMNRFELFDLTDECQELTGNAYWYIVKNSVGVPVEIWPLSPDRMTIVPSRVDWIAGYLYRTLDGVDVPFTVDEIIHFRFPNPNNSYYGWAPLQAMADTYNMDQQMDQHRLALLGNSAIPPIALVAPKDAMVTEEQWKSTMRRWNQTYGGARNQGKTAWLESGFDIKSLATNPKDLSFLGGEKSVMTKLCAAYGLPLSKITTDAVGRANAESGDYQYMADTIRPRHVLTEERLNERLVPMVDENLVFMFENCVPDDKDFALREQESHLKSSVTTINEERKKIGMESVEWGDKPLVPSSTVLLGEQPVPVPGQQPGPGQQEEQLTKQLTDIVFLEVERRRREMVG
jgi:HK97 family phage portal protein